MIYLHHSLFYLFHLYYLAIFCQNLNTKKKKLLHKQKTNNGFSVAFFILLFYLVSMASDILTLSPPKMGIFGMTLKCIWQWGSNSGALGCVAYPFIVITSGPTRTWSGSTCSGPIYESNRSVWKLFVLGRNTWHHITVQMNYYY